MEGAISIHSLRVEGDAKMYYNKEYAIHFNPLPPCGGRQSIIQPPPELGDISIHSLRVEGDSKIAQLSA